MIFGMDRDLVKDFAIMLLLDSYNPKERACTVMVANTTAWRLLLTYTKNRREGEIILESDAKVVLDAHPEELSRLEAHVYGKGWGKFQRSSLDLYTDLKREALDNVEHDIELVVDGAHGKLAQWKQFSVTCKAYKLSEYMPVSLVPTSRYVMDAFPCVKYKIDNNMPINARNFLQLSDEAACGDPVEIAYERLKRIWEQDRLYNARNSAYIDRVLEFLAAAYNHLRRNDPFFPRTFDVDEEIPLRETSEKRNSHVWLRDIFFNKRRLTPDEVRIFFTRLCIEMQQLFVLNKDFEGRTAYEVALEQGHEELAQQLHPVNIEQGVGKKLENQLAACFKLKPRGMVMHLPEASILQSIALQNSRGGFGQTVSETGSRLYGQLPSVVHKTVETASFLVTVPIIGALIPIGGVINAQNRRNALLQAAALPVTVPAAVIVSIPVGLFLLLMQEVLDDM